MRIDASLDTDEEITYTWLSKKEQDGIEQMKITQTISSAFEKRRDYLPSFVPHHLTEQNQSSAYRRQKESIPSDSDFFLHIEIN